MYKGLLPWLPIYKKRVTKGESCLKLGKSPISTHSPLRVKNPDCDQDDIGYPLPPNGQVLDAPLLMDVFAERPDDYRKLFCERTCDRP
jgi:hypothetical protein